MKASRQAATVWIKLALRCALGKGIEKVRLSYITCDAVSQGWDLGVYFFNTDLRRRADYISSWSKSITSIVFQRTKLPLQWHALPVSWQACS